MVRQRVTCEPKGHAEDPQVLAEGQEEKTLSGRSDCGFCAFASCQSDLGIPKKKPAAGGAHTVLQVAADSEYISCGVSAKRLDSEHSLIGFNPRNHPKPDHCAPDATVAWDSRYRTPRLAVHWKC